MPALQAIVVLTIMAAPAIALGWALARHRRDHLKNATLGTLLGQSAYLFPNITQVLPSLLLVSAAAAGLGVLSYVAFRIYDQHAGPSVSRDQSTAMIGQTAPGQHDPRCISLTDSEFNDHCDCRTLRMIDQHQASLTDGDRSDGATL